MHEHVAEAGDLAPGDIGVGGLELIGDAQQQVALHPAQHLLGV